MQSSVKRGLWALLVIVIILWLLPPSQAGQLDQKQNPPPKAGFDWSLNIERIVALIAVIFGIYQYFKSKKVVKVKKLAELEAVEKFEEEQKTKVAQTVEEQYRETLRGELAFIGIFGSPDFRSLPVSLADTFVSLRVSPGMEGEYRLDPKKKGITPEEERYPTPAAVMERAFKQYHLLLVIGDPGSGKTTLLKYYALCCLDRKHGDLGFKKEILPMFLPLRDLLFKGRWPVSLPDSLCARAEKHNLNIPAKQFDEWLHRKQTLVLLDGLDEVGEVTQRRAVCDWIKRVCSGFAKARFVVTSRLTGYRKRDCIELECPHLRADVLDFSPDQQREFLNKWFRASYLNEFPDDRLPPGVWKNRQEQEAADKARTIIEFLERPGNKGLRELSGIPMLLQIMAIVWKEREYLPHSRSALYDSSINYLLGYRDQWRNIDPLLPVEQARRLVEPTALWMQEELEADEAAKDQMHRYMEAILEKFRQPPSAEAFCANLRDRAGLIADCGEDHYMFRHKTFREFLAAAQLVQNAPEEGRVEALARHVGDDWWDEALRFFMGKVTGQLFGRFITAFFDAHTGKELDEGKHALLLNLVRESPEIDIKSLVTTLHRDDLDDRQVRCLLDCLKASDKKEAFHAIRYADKSSWGQSNRNYADDIVAETLGIPEKPAVVEEAASRSFRNPFEDNVEYILIPGGSYTYSVSKKEVTIPDMYFCKHPVTNKRYRRFMAYLAGEEKEMARVLPLDLFAPKLRAFAGPIKGFIEKSGKQPEEWLERFACHDDRRFNGPDQPVVGIRWYAARAYCFWLSCLDAAQQGDFKNRDVDALSSVYRLPNEWEWQWAASGREPDGSLREYPWPKTKGQPTPELANYDKNVGATTPVGRYPEGATPEGLMDMAGNVWEWMENWYDEDEVARALRGGSWFYDECFLRCSARLYYDPQFWSYYFGFRVVRCQLSGLR
jgi:formylglycine-generating enzyme required for sulfatase activity/energy-coupling factor transporter ATP-binding protein EcfA2